MPRSRSCPINYLNLQTPCQFANDMTTKTLIDTAVLNSTTTGHKGLADRLFASWFNRLVYAQIWEDPISDLDALQLKPGAHLLTISSGGCNALAYLTANPGAVHAVDLNATHLATLDIKRSALRHLPKYEDVLAFLGSANTPENSTRYQRWIAPHLQESSLEYWESRDFLGRPRYRYFNDHFYRHGLLGDFIGFSHKLVRLLGGNLSKVAEAETLEAQREAFEKHVAPVFRNPLIRFLSNRPAVLYSLGIPPSQFDAIRRDAAGGMSTDFCERMRRLACDWPIRENCFAMQAFARSYDANVQSSLPLYLQQAHYESVRNQLDQLHLHHTTLTDFLHAQPQGSLDAYLFLDAQDWMDNEQITALWREVTRTARQGARVVFRTGGATSPLERMLPADILAAWRTDPVHNRRLHASDRSAIYGGMHLYERA